MWISGRRIWAEETTSAKVRRWDKGPVSKAENGSGGQGGDKGRSCRALWATGRILAFLEVGWETLKALSRGPRCPDLGAHWRPLAAVGGGRRPGRMSMHGSRW